MTEIDFRKLLAETSNPEPVVREEAREKILNEWKRLNLEIKEAEKKAVEVYA